MKYGPAKALSGENIRITMDTYTEPFWLAAKERRLTACKCGDCGEFRIPPGPFCPHCRSQVIEWPTLSGTGTVYSFAICSNSPIADHVYVPVIVEIDGAPGVRLIANLSGGNAEDVEIGMKVEVDWTPIMDGWVLPNFRRA